MGDTEAMSEAGVTEISVIWSTRQMSAIALAGLRLG